jgi:serine/threonine-protein kinase
VEQQDRATQQLNALLASPQFAQSRRMQRFLDFVVRRALEGGASGIKEYTIGVEVFDRPADFDPRIDSIVRVEARRLRRKLREYYAGPGKNDPVVISLPEGSYVPQFTGIAIPEPAAPASPSPAGPRLAVLPLEITPPSASALMLAAALTDDLLGALARIPGLLVVTRSASLRFAQPDRDLRAVSADLGVDWVLEGSLRRTGDGWRLNVLLADCATGFARWSETFEATSIGLQTIHLRIAPEVAARLGVPAPPAPPPEDTLPAFRHLLEGRHLMLQMTPRSLRRAAEAFRRATQADPSLAPAWAGRAGSLFLMGIFGDTAPTMIAADATADLQRALALNPELPQAHAWRGFHRASFEWNWDAAEEDFLHSLDANPNLIHARVWLAGAVYVPLRRYEEASAQLEIARRLDAANPLVLAMTGLFSAFAGDLPAALSSLAAARDLSQIFYGAHHLQARVHAAFGQYRQALEILDQARPRALSDPRNLALTAVMRARLGQFAEARDIASSLQLTAESTYVSAYDMAVLFAALGDIPAAAGALMQALAEHEPWLIFIRQDPLIRPLEGTPQYTHILETLFNERAD